MKAKTFNLRHLLFAVLVALSQTACDNAVFSSQSQNEKTGGGGGGGPLDVDPQEIVFIDDSFERDDLFIDIANQIVYGWRGFIFDGNQDTLGLTDPDGSAIRIPPVGEFAAAGHIDRALYMYGDPDSEIEVLQVVSRSYDLSQFRTALIAFKYLTFGLNDADDAVTESLQLQVCRGTLNECGANDDLLFADGLRSGNWVTVFDSNDNTNFNDDALNGKNHQMSDWQQGLAVVDLTDPAFVGDSSTFVFRFIAVMEEGLATGTCTETCVDECDEDSVRSSKIERLTAGHDGKDKDSKKDDKDDCDHKHDKKDKDCKHKDCKNGKCKHDCKHKDCKNGKCKHDCKHKDCKNGKCKHKDCKKKCTKVCQPGDGSLRDGVAIDQVFGRATTLTIDEIF